jgi:large subunit ribosomal protein L2
MGKRIISQRRGRGTSTYRAHSFNYKGMVSHRIYDQIEQEGVVSGKILDIMHCPGHSAPLALIEYENKERVLTLACKGMNTKQIVQSGSKAEPLLGNTVPISSVEIGTEIFNIENSTGDGGKYVKAAGGSAKVVSKSDKKVKIKFASKKFKEITNTCRVTIGVIASTGKTDKPFVKAGNRYYAMKARNKLWPKTSGVAMNSVDHPFGSGRGRHIGKSKVAPRNAPPGRKVGPIRARRLGKKK